MPSKRWCDASGGAALEFAIIAPVFLVFLLGLTSYGIYFGAAHGVQQLAADAARVSVAGLTDMERRQLAIDHVARNAAKYAFLKAGRVSVVAGPDVTDPTEFEVAVNFDASALPIWVTRNILPMPSQTISRTATIKRGGY